MAQYHDSGQPHTFKYRWMIMAVAGLGVLAGVWFLADRFFDLRPVASSNLPTEQFMEADFSGPVEVDEELFSFELPSDWEEIERQTSGQGLIITWQSTRADRHERYLTLYQDDIPSDRPLNRILPVEADGNRLSKGELSYNCVTLLEQSNEGVGEEALAPVKVRWQQVEFWCNLPNLFSHEIGIGSSQGVNRVRIAGSSGEEHDYFLVYSDHTANPTTTVFLNAIRTFRAK